MLPRSLGHRAGVEALRGVITMSSDIGIEVLTLYAFSTENWARPQEEVGVLMDLLVEFLNKEIAELHENDVNIRFMGDVDKFPEQCRAAITNAIELTRNNKGLKVNIALNYGGRHEIVRAVKSILIEVEQGNIDKEMIGESTISDHLYTAGLPDPDLLIRTSGEMRLSNFMLYQSSYSELYIPDTLWPDFNETEYEKGAFGLFEEKKKIRENIRIDYEKQSLGCDTFGSPPSGGGFHRIGGFKPNDSGVRGAGSGGDVKGVKPRRIHPDFVDGSYFFRADLSHGSLFRHKRRAHAFCDTYRHKHVLGGVPAQTPLHGHNNVGIHIVLSRASFLLYVHDKNDTAAYIFRYSHGYGACARLAQRHDGIFCGKEVREKQACAGTKPEENSRGRRRGNFGFRYNRVCRAYDTQGEILS